MARVIQPDHWTPVTDRLPEQHIIVLILVADPSVAIDAKPAVAHMQVEFSGTPNARVDWWTGLPGRYQRLSDGWVVTHWMPMPTWRDGHWRTRGTCLGTERGGA